MIALDGQPISVVEDPGFINLINSLEPRYKIPSRKYLTDNLFSRIITGVKAELNKLLKTMSNITVLQQIYGVPTLHTGPC